MTQDERDNQFLIGAAYFTAKHHRATGFLSNADLASYLRRFAEHVAEQTLRVVLENDAVMFSVHSAEIVDKIPPFEDEERP